MKNIAIIGSSGGNLFNLGGKEPNKLLNEIIIQAESVEFKISDIIFIGAKSSMDNVKYDVKSSIFYLEDSQIMESDIKDLKSTNIDAKNIDIELSKKIRSGLVDALILMSCDPKNTNNASIEAATEKRIPIVGTSMAYIQSKDANVIAVSGTVGTTNRTRAIG